MGRRGAFVIKLWELKLDWNLGSAKFYIILQANP